jgi:hypothetical protein
MEDDFFHKVPAKKEDKVKEIVLDEVDTELENKLADEKSFIPDQK